jgi:hypothetical protein
VNKHDDGCAIYRNGDCNCNVELELREMPKTS